MSSLILDIERNITINRNIRNLERMKKIEHIVLDIDSTLIDSNYRHEIFPRPFLEEFLFFVFTNFISVSLWTAAGIDWLNIVYNTVLKPRLPSNAKFRVMLYGDHCITISSYRSTNEKCKPLSIIYMIHPDMNSENTLMVDDFEGSFLMNNQNSYQIKPYNYDEEDKDDELMGLVCELQKYGHCNGLI